MSQQVRFAWATKPTSDQAEEPRAIELDPQARAVVVALMARGRSRARPEDGMLCYAGGGLP